MFDERMVMAIVVILTFLVYIELRARNLQSENAVWSKDHDSLLILSSLFQLYFTSPPFKEDTFFIHLTEFNQTMFNRQSEKE